MMIKKISLFTISILVFGLTLFSCSNDTKTDPNTVPETNNPGTNNPGDETENGNEQESNTVVYAADCHNLRYWKNGELISLLNIDGDSPINNYQMGGIDNIKENGDTVYMCGVINALTGPKVGYWKNDEWIELHSSTENVARATSMYISNDDIYICGYEQNVAEYIWKNDSEVFLENNLTDRLYYATTMTICDEYLIVGGYKELKEESGYNNYVEYVNPREWHYDLGDTSTGIQYTTYSTCEATQIQYVNTKVNSITATSNSDSIDIYAGGYSADRRADSTSPNPINMAGYWKSELTSGTRTWNSLSDGTTDAEVLSIVISNNIVYAAGYLTESSGIRIAGYWENSEWTPLSDGTNDAEAACIVIDGDDLYVGGYLIDSGVMTPGYWLNGEWTPLTLQSEHSSYFMEETMVSCIVVVHE